jgi:hypothetical protein
MKRIEKDLASFFWEKNTWKNIMSSKIRNNHKNPIKLEYKTKIRKQKKYFI